MEHANANDEEERRETGQRVRDHSETADILTIACYLPLPHRGPFNLQKGAVSLNAKGGNEINDETTKPCHAHRKSTLTLTVCSLCGSDSIHRFKQEFQRNRDNRDR